MDENYERMEKGEKKDLVATSSCIPGESKMSTIQEDGYGNSFHYVW